VVVAKFHRARVDSNCTSRSHELVLPQKHNKQTCLRSKALEWAAIQTATQRHDSAPGRSGSRGFLLLSFPLRLHERAVRVIRRVHHHHHRRRHVHGLLLRLCLGSHVDRTGGGICVCMLGSDIRWSWRVYGRRMRHVLRVMVLRLLRLRAGTVEVLRRMRRGGLCER
jgi:hypothetical protein